MSKNAEFWIELKDEQVGPVAVKYGVGLALEGDLEDVERQLRDGRFNTTTDARKFMHDLIDSLFDMAKDVEVVERGTADGG